MNKYILLRNQKSAEIIAGKINAIVCESHEDVCGRDLQDGDVIIIDAHHEGAMSDLKGFKTVGRLQRYYCKDKDVKFKIFSWFPSTWYDENPNLMSSKKKLFSESNVDLVQLPISDIK